MKKTTPKAKRKTKKSFWHRARSAVTGLFISMWQALRDPEHSVVEKVRATKKVD